MSSDFDIAPAERWIVIPNWSEFQHYKNRDPSWIKAYTRLMKDDDFMRLSLRLRGILFSLWLLYAASDGLVSGSSPARLGRMLGADEVRTRDIEALNHAGLITLSASKPLALRYQAASPEKSKRRTPLPPTGETPKPAGQRPTCPVSYCGYDFHSEQALAEHLEHVHDIRPEPDQ